MGKLQKDTSTLSNEVISHATNLQFKASLFQDSHHPGSTMYLSATLTEFGTPVDHRAKVRAKVILPDDNTTNLSFQEIHAGHFKADYITAIPGTYTFHVHAKGMTLDGTAFTKTINLTGAVYYGD